MSSIVVTGATGRLGRLVVEALLRRGVPATEIVATGRDTDKLEGMAERGIAVRRADFADPGSLTAAFAGARTLLLVSTTTVGERIGNHQRAIDAAKAAGVSRVVYTSQTNAETATMQLATEHRETEHYLRASGLPFTILRNGWYLDNYTDQLEMFLQHRTVVGSAGQGRVSAASRADLAEAAANVLTTEGHLGAVYELGGDHAFTLAELAASLSEAAGEDIAYQDMPAEHLAQVLTGAGLPPELAAVLADADLGLGRGELRTDTGDLSRLLGRPATSLNEALSAALAERTAQ